MKTTLTFIPEGEHYRVLETGDLCSFPIIGKNVTVIENYSVGLGHSAHPNIDESGSVEGMKALGYWHRSDHIIKARGFYYNMSSVVTSHILDKLCLAIEKNDCIIDQSNKNRIIFTFPV